MYQRISVIFLGLLWLMLGTGLLAYVHELDHQREDGRRGVPARHDDGNCPIHAQLHMPLQCAGEVTVSLTLEQVREPLVAADQRVCEASCPDECGSRDPPGA